jgi:hypothetical protein
VQLIDLVVSPAPKPAPANTNPDTKPATITKNALATTINTTAWTTFPWTIYNIDISFHYSFNAFSGQSFYLPSDYLSTILGVLFDHSSTILRLSFDYSSTILFLPPNKERHLWKFSHHPRLPKPHLLWKPQRRLPRRLWPPHHFSYSSTILRLFFGHSSSYPLAILSVVDTASQHGAKQVNHH